MGTGWNVTAYTCCIETVAALSSRAVPEKGAEEEGSGMEMDVDSGGVRNGEQILTKTKGE